MSVSEIDQMSTTERLQAMEDLWSALSCSSTDISPPAWHEEIVRERIEQMNSPDAKFFTLDQLKDHFRR